MKCARSQPYVCIAGLLLLLILPHRGWAQVMEQVLSSEFSLTAQAAPATEVLPASVPHPSQPESLANLEQPTVRVGLQIDDLMRIKTASSSTVLRLNRLNTTVMGTVETPRFGPITYGAEVTHAQGDEQRNTRTSILEMDHQADTLRLTAYRPLERERFQALQLVEAHTNIDGRTDLLTDLMQSTTVKPFAVDGSNRSLTATYGQVGDWGGYTARLGYRWLNAPLAISGTTNRLTLDFAGNGLIWEVRGWRKRGDLEGGALLGGQVASGDSDVRYNADRQGNTHASFTNLAVGFAGRWQRTPEERFTAQLVHSQAHITADANILFPDTDDFVDFLGGTGIAHGYLKARATSAHGGWEREEGPYILRAGGQLALLDLTAGYRYRTQFMGGVRNQSAEETAINNAILVIVAGGIERNFSWGRIGYGLALTKPFHYVRRTRELAPETYTRASTAASVDKSVRGGMIHTLRVEWWL